MGSYPLRLAPSSQVHPVVPRLSGVLSTLGRQRCLGRTSAHASCHSSETGIVALQAAGGTALPSRGHLVDPTMMRAGTLRAGPPIDARRDVRARDRMHNVRAGHIVHQRMPDRFAPPCLPLSAGAISTRGPRLARRMLPESPGPDAIRTVLFTISWAANNGEAPQPSGAPTAALYCGRRVHRQASLSDMHRPSIHG